MCIMYLQFPYTHIWTETMESHREHCDKKDHLLTKVDIIIIKNKNKFLCITNIILIHT